MSTVGKVSATFAITLVGLFVQSPAFGIEPLLTGVQQLSAGNSQTCAVLADTSVACWGKNAALGVDSDVPVAIYFNGSSRKKLSGISAVGVGEDFACALQAASGYVFCWGNNNHGQLGIGDNRASWAPSKVVLSAASSISVGASHACAVMDDANQTVSCWGWNLHGQLGDGTTQDAILAVPVSVAKSGGTRESLTGTMQVTAGNSHTCALMQDGSAKCWGLNTFGRLGIGTVTDTTSPTIVMATTADGGNARLMGVTQIVAGSGHSCAVTAPYVSARCWGDNANGAVGNTNVMGYTSYAEAVVPDPGVKQISVNRNGGTCAALVDGRLACWGFNGNLQLGNAEHSQIFAPSIVSSISSAQMVSAGDFDTCAILTDTTVECWGSNSYGALGTGSGKGGDVASPSHVVAGLVDDEIFASTFQAD